MSLTEIKKFIHEGSYMKLKCEMEKLRVLKNMIRTEQDELNLKRIVWKELGVVGEFETIKQYSYDQREINVLLNDLGLLQLITFIRHDELMPEEKKRIKDIQYPSELYLKFSPGKNFNIETTALFDRNLNQISMLEKVALWKEAYDKFSFLKISWKKLRIKAQFSDEWKKSKKHSFDHGTLSIIESPLTYRTDKVFDTLGIETVLRTARADSMRFLEFSARGFISKQEINKLRKVINVKRRYLLMTIQKENRKKEGWYLKLTHLSKLSQL